MKLLFCASEAYPFAKSGGLADVAHALPKALAAYCDVTLMLPFYRFMDLGDLQPETIAQIRLSFGGATYTVRYLQAHDTGVRVLFVASPLLSERDHLYGPPGEAYGDNDLRFALFSHAIARFLQMEAFDILHLNDWHTALAALFVKERKASCRVVFTIHNLAFQGVFDRVRLALLGIDPRHFHPEALEFYGKINFLKAGIAFCDLLTTVSPTYAEEIRTPEFGCGLEGFLHRHAAKLVGILNGIDTELFDPRRDPALACTMKRKIATFKRCNKKALRGVREDLPLFIFIGRLTEQKGVDLLIALTETLSRMPLQFAFLGEGDAQTQQWLDLAARRSDNILHFSGYDEALAHRLYAAADFLVMPSRFEPCGLNQMIAMRYGTIPIVHAIGGLKDTVHREGWRCGLGLPYDRQSEAVLLEMLRQALTLYHERDETERINRFNMACDFSFDASARKYLACYQHCGD